MNEDQLNEYARKQMEGARAMTEAEMAAAQTQWALGAQNTASFESGANADLRNFHIYEDVQGVTLVVPEHVPWWRRALRKMGL